MSLVVIISHVLAHSTLELSVQYMYIIYHIILYSGKLRRGFITWLFGEFGIDRQTKNTPIEPKAYVPMMVRLQIAKFKLNSPIPMESHFIKFNACLSYSLYGRSLGCVIYM